MVSGKNTVTVVRGYRGGRSAQGRKIVSRTASPGRCVRARPADDRISLNEVPACACTTSLHGTRMSDPRVSTGQRQKETRHSKTLGQVVPLASGHSAGAILPVLIFWLFWTYGSRQRPQHRAVARPYLPQDHGCYPARLRMIRSTEQPLRNEPNFD